MFASVCYPVILYQNVVFSLFETNAFAPQSSYSERGSQCNFRDGGVLLLMLSECVILAKKCYYYRMVKLPRASTTVTSL